jgi:hypothetical protein
MPTIDQSELERWRREEARRKWWIENRGTIAMLLLPLFAAVLTLLRLLGAK